MSALEAAIHSQPDELRRIAFEERDACERAAGLLDQAGRVLLVGTGTSMHAARVGMYLLREADIDAWAVPAFDFALYPPVLRPDDAVIVISHRGTKRYSVQALAHAAAAGAVTLAVVGHGAPAEGAQVVLRTVPQERSATHAAGYTGALAVLAGTAAALGRRRGRDMSALTGALSRLPGAIEAVLSREGDIRALAEALPPDSRLAFAGGGPNGATATEAALKVKEAAYLTAEGWDVEAFLHGPFAAMQAGDLIALVCAEGPALERITQLALGAADIGARVWSVGVNPGVPDAAHFSVAALPEPLSAAVLVVPFQLLALHLARVRGTDPDAFRLDDPRFKRASTRWSL